MLTPLLLASATATPVAYDFRNWYVAETLVEGEKSCSFSLSPNFYGVTILYRPSQADFQVAIDSPAVHVLPTGPLVPLKISIRGQVESVKGVRVDQQLFFPISREMVDSGMNRKGMIQILLSHPSIGDRLIARYRMSGAHYEASFDRFTECRARIVAPLRMASGSAPG
ncbi:MAG TPA: hypothetical protein VF503_18810 [Sphingobium sp.]|uniref:hypothetical protein n=1 Tax=Sphingobium sp. TaxID=1912891 RepID=UPI002ED598D6